MSGIDWEVVNTLVQTTATVAAVGTLIFGVRDLRRGQKWKRTEFVAELVKDWETQPGVHAVFALLDYSRKRIVPTDYGGKTSESQVVDGETIAVALELPDERAKKLGAESAVFSAFEVDLRDYFDAFLEGPARFRQHVTAGLVDTHDFRPYLQYWCGRLGKEAIHDGLALSAIRDYAKEFHPGAVEVLSAIGATFTTTGAT